MHTRTPHIYICHICICHKTSSTYAIPVLPKSDHASFLLKTRLLNPGRKASHALGSESLFLPSSRVAPLTICKPPALCSELTPPTSLLGNQELPSDFLQMSLPQNSHPELASIFLWAFLGTGNFVFLRFITLLDYLPVYFLISNLEKGWQISQRQDLCLVDRVLSPMNECMDDIPIAILSPKEKKENSIPYFFSEVHYPPGCWIVDVFGGLENGLRLLMV